MHNKQQITGWLFLLLLCVAGCGQPVSKKQNTMINWTKLPDLPGAADTAFPWGFAPAPATGSEPPFWHEVPPGWRNLLAGPGGSSPPTATHVVGLAVGGPPCGRRLETRPFLWKGVRRYVQYPILCPPQALQHLQCPGGRTAPRRPPGRGGGVCHPAGPPERFLFRHRPAVGPPLR